MATPKPDRVADVRNAIQNGFRIHARAERRYRSVQLADDLSTIHDELSDAELPTEDTTNNIRFFFGNIDRQLQRTRKVVEVVEDSLRIGLGHSKLARLAMTGAQINSGVALVIAGHNLLISADELDRAHAAAGSTQEMAVKPFHNFYRALGVLVAEAILFTTPFNYRIAWKGTRYLNNKFLYSLRHSGLSGSLDDVLKGLHRLILSEIHYAIRGILPAALQDPGEFVTYLTSMAAQTLDLLQEFSTIDLTEIPSKAEEIIDEYRIFTKDTYEVVTADVDVGAIVPNVVEQVANSGDIL